MELIDMKKRFCLTLGIVLIFSCGDDIIEEVTASYADGSVKSLLRYIGNEAFKDTIETFIFSPKGDTLVWENKVDSTRVGKSYHPNDSLESEKFYASGSKTGNWVVYFNTGQIQTSVNFINGKAEGAYVDFHQTGKVALKGNLKDGLKDGEWQTFDDTGYMIGLCRYSNGVEFIGEGRCREPRQWIGE